MVVTCQKSSAWETIGLELLDLCSGLKSSVLQSRVSADATPAVIKDEANSDKSGATEQATDNG
jgi:hypothetical protein